jgi:hypothetical protein
MPESPTNPARPKRRKTGGRQKGTPNKSTAAIREAMLHVFADLQADAGRENGHFLEWARDHSTDFYKLLARLLPRQVVIPEGGLGITHIRRTLVHPPAQPQPQPQLEPDRPAEP